METHLYWEPGQTPVNLRPMLAALGDFYPVCRGGDKGILLASRLWDTRVALL